MSFVLRFALPVALILLVACQVEKDEQQAVAVNPHVATDEGKILYQKHCSSCHNSDTPGTPAQIILAELSEAQLLATMNTGAMRVQAGHLEDHQKTAISQFLAANQAENYSASVKYCNSTFAGLGQQDLNLQGWGMTLQNRRHTNSDLTNIRSDNVSNLALKWTFTYPEANRARSQPLLIGDLVVVGSHNGTVFGLNKVSGCVHWEHKVGAEVRTGITPLKLSQKNGANRWLGFFSDFAARGYAIDLETGKEVWQISLDQHPAATGTGQPAAYKDTVYFPVSSVEPGSAANAKYACCTFRGSVLAVNAETGTTKWRQYTTSKKPTKQGKNPVGTKQFGPSGSPIWSSPTIDPKRQMLYVGTGENYSEPADNSSDAIIAMALADGKIKWIRQTTQGDAWNAACLPGFGSSANCPTSNGPDFDYGSPPILVENDDGDILVGAQKSGMAYGVNPENGEVVWAQRVGRGGVLGGTHFGLAATKNQAFIPIFDSEFGRQHTSAGKPGIYAVSVNDGQFTWQSPAPKELCSDKDNCETGISAPPTVISDLVFVPHAHGVIRAHEVSTGEVRWRFDTAREFIGVSGDTGRGGGISGGTGVVAAGDWLYANSGYYNALLPKPGNVLLAFSISDTSN